MIDPARRGAIVRLLEQLLDGLPVRSPSSFTSSGFVHDDAEESCPDCLANDRTMLGCETCGGSGRLRIGRRRDPYQERYTRPFGYDQNRHDRRYVVDAEITMLARQTAEPLKSELDLLAAANERAEAWELVRARMWREYDFASLTRALEVLRAADDDAYRAVYATHVHGWLPQEGAVAAHVERALVFIDRWMPRDGIRAPQREVVADRTLAGRNQAIRRRFFEEEVPVKALAVEFGLSVSQVNRVLAGEEASA